MARPLTLLADVGGTNARFALSEHRGEFDRQSVLATRDYTSLTEAINAYAAIHKVVFRRAVIAIACPVNTDQISMTNNDWSFSQQALANALFPDGLKLINDFEAVALSLPHIPTEHLIAIGKGQAVERGPMCVLGPGTGLGVAHMVHDTDWQAISCEGGHSGLTPSNQRELEVFAYWLDKGKPLTREWFLSGRGLENIHEALTARHGGYIDRISAQEIQKKATEDGDSLSVESLEIFCELLGTVAADQAFSSGTSGGIFLAGGMLSHFKAFFLSSGFRQRFEDRGAMSYYTKRIPSYLITEPQPGLLGASWC